jgi:hypothetical protein
MPRQENSFTKAFLPGLILGIVVGGFAGAYLTGGGTGPTIEPPKAGATTGAGRPRDSGETPPVIPVPVIDQGAADGGQAGTPAVTDPKTPTTDPTNAPAADPKAPPANPPANDPGATPAANPGKPLEPK